MLNNNQAKKIDYRRTRHKQPNEFERADLKARLYKFSNQQATAGVFSTTIQNVVMAFDGRNALLMNKIKSYIEKMEARNGGDGK